jgi:hypothetical protein
MDWVWGSFGLLIAGGVVMLVVNALRGKQQNVTNDA